MGIKVDNINDYKLEIDTSLGKISNKNNKQNNDNKS